MKLPGLAGDHRQVALAATKVVELLGQVRRLIFEHLGLDPIELPHAIEPLAYLVELGLDNRDAGVQCWIIKGDQRLARCHRSAGRCQHLGDEALGLGADLGLIGNDDHALGDGRIGERYDEEQDPSRSRQSPPTTA